MPHHDAETLNRAYLAHRDEGMDDNQAFAAACLDDLAAIAADCRWREGCSSHRQDGATACGSCRHTGDQR